jgi:S1-C subfamily serine protease
LFKEVQQMSASLVDLSNALAAATDRAAASTVAVHTEARGSSSGVIWRPGVIVTADHALRRDEEIHVTLAGGKVAPASLAGRDSSTDLAVLKCSEAASVPAESDDAGAARPGSLVLAVGRTRASGPVATLGVVSLVAAERRAWTGAALSPYIRLDVALQPTAVGGAAVDPQGRIFGIATPRFAQFGAIVIPAPTVNRVVDILLKKGRVPRGYLGVGLQPVHLPEELRQSLQRAEKTAAIILQVEPKSPAHIAGILIGDILVSLADQPVAHLENVQSHLHSENIGKTLTAKVLRGGTLQTMNILVGEREHASREESD